MPWNGGLTEDDSMVSAGLKPWHQDLGIGVKERADELMTWEEAYERAGLTWEVEKRKVYAGSKHRSIAVPGYVATVRADKDIPLGVVKESYSVIQNSECFAFLNALVDSGDLQYETAGSLQQGRMVWALAHVPADIDLGEGGNVKSYLLMTNNHDGRGAATAAVTPIRVECQNTLDAALRTQRRFAIRHIGNTVSKLEEARQALGITFAYMETFEAVARRLLGTPLSAKEIVALTEELVPSPRDPDEPVPTRTLNRREAILSIVNGADNLQNVKGTAWGFYNAVAQYADHEITYRETKGSPRAENRALAIIGGSASEMKDKALALVLPSAVK